MSIIGLLLGLAALLIGGAILYGSYKIWQSAKVDDEIAAQEEIKKAAARVAAYTEKNSASSIRTNEEAIENLLKTRNKRK